MGTMEAPKPMGIDSRRQRACQKGMVLYKRLYWREMQLSKDERWGARGARGFQNGGRKRTGLSGGREGTGGRKVNKLSFHRFPRPGLRNRLPQVFGIRRIRKQIKCLLPRIEFLKR